MFLDKSYHLSTAERIEDVRQIINCRGAGRSKNLVGARSQIHRTKEDYSRLNEN